MEREALNRLQGLRESEVPYPAGLDLGINPDQKPVVVNNSRFPERVMIEAPVATSGIVEV